MDEDSTLPDNEPDYLSNYGKVAKELNGLLASASKRQGEVRDRNREGPLDASLRYLLLLLQIPRKPLQKKMEILGSNLCGPGWFQDLRPANLCVLPPHLLQESPQTEVFVPSLSPLLQGNHGTLTRSDLHLL